jgi:transposase
LRSATSCSGPGRSTSTPTTAESSSAACAYYNAGSKPLLGEHAGKGARYRYGRRFARNLLKVWPALWTFAKRPGVQPTNNHAERALRGAVIYRKLSLGSQSDHGERRIERLLSASTTCRLQRRSLHAYLIDALAAHTRGDPAPLLA